MSSSGEGAGAGPSAPKRRKVVNRACDYCRRKKSDGPRMPNKRCSKCVSRRAECTYIEPFQKSSYPDSYVQDLETRLGNMEALIRKLNPEVDLVKALESERISDSLSRPTSAPTSPSSPGSQGTTGLTVPQLAINVLPEKQGDNDNSEEDIEIAHGIAQLSINPSLRYSGKSSGRAFLQTTMGMREDYLREISPDSARDQPSSMNLKRRHHRRQPWLDRLSSDEPLPPECFPPPDLMDELVRHYFRQANDYLPLLHEPTFLRGIQEELHLRHRGFGATVLLAAAIGARYSHDNRVLLEGSGPAWHSAGWKWFKVVDDMHRSFFASPSLYDLQVCVLLVLYMQTTTMPYVTWTAVGVGLRMAVDVGAHRNFLYKSQPTVEDELWRRAFWALVTLEWGTSYGLGRPACIYDEEIDVSLPTECDDEHWTADNLAEAFKQPPGKPSMVSFTNCFIGLSRLIAHATRTIYSPRKSRAHIVNRDEEWDERIVAELDSELNKWLDTVPGHLRWDPKRENALFLGQSAVLYAAYYHVQISVHRAFITKQRGSPLSLASLIICTNAARSCVQVLEQLCKRIGTPLARNASALFLSGLVLVMSMWGQKRSGRVLGADKDLEHLKKCISMLGMIEREYNVAEDLKDMLESLSSIDGPPSTSREGPCSQGSTAEAHDTRGANAPVSQTPTGAPTPSVGIPRGGPGPDFSRNWSTTRSVNATLSLAREVSTTPAANSWQAGHALQAPPRTVTSQPVNIDPGVFSAGASSEGSGMENAVLGLSGGRGMDVDPGGAQGLPAPAGSANGRGGNAGLPMDLAAFGGLNGVDLDFGLQDFGFVNDALDVWSGAPSSFGWEDWDAYFNTVNNGAQPSGT
ncbi:fungal-specific transcription factor domain-containing protein [Trametes elegans]|nr:fungal-specific transcription factor domain-containing protein [Trametes elegans]